LDENGRFVEVNQAWLDTLDYSRDDVIGRWFGEFLSPASVDRFNENFPLLKSRGETHSAEFEMVRKDGSHIVASFDGRVSYDNLGNFKQTHCILHDVTERRQMDQQLREHYEEEKALREKLETEIGKRVEFTRTLTHELKTPLTSVLASSDLLASEAKDPNLQNLAMGISRSASNLNSRIDELLDLAKGEIGMLELSLEDVELSQLLLEAAESATPLASKREQSLALDVPKSLPPVEADPARIHQILANLLGNAVKFTPKGGKITLRGRQEGSALIVEVQDSGRGLSKKEQNRIFEPYHRLEGDRQRLSGLGLGLPLCKSLVELHGGQIWVTSAAGKGSTFGFSIPVEAPDQAATEPTKTQYLWKVLMIEDDPEIVSFVSTAFELRWPEAQLVSTDQGEDGVDLVERENPDIVVLDLGLPDVSGFEALRQIRLFTSVPVVILTVRSEEDDIVKGLEWGADDYLVKPFRQMELLARLKVQLRKQTATDEEAPIVCGPLRLEPSTAQLTYGDKDISLTVIEGHIMSCLMSNAGHIVTYTRLAEAVWGEDYPGVLDTLRVNIRRMRAKLEDDPKNPELILTKAGVGYVLAKSAWTSSPWC
jgi:two-component system KDP operon response regulator KdpE